MKIVITDSGILWHYGNPILKNYKDLVLVVCLHGSKVTDEYECFICPRKSVGLGMSMGVGSRVYNDLEDVADELYDMLQSEDDILFLTDGDPNSLYPYHIIKNRKHYMNIHLWASPPWNIEGKARMKAHKEMLSDLSGVKSICYIDTQDYLKNDYKNFGELLEAVQNYFKEIFPIVIDSISKLEKESYFDLVSKSYIPLNKASVKETILKSSEYLSDKDEYTDNMYLIEGMVDIPEYQRSDKYKRDIIYRQVARIDGKKICNLLREYRYKLNDIEFYSEECRYVGACAGTCEKCDEEAEYLSKKLSEIPKEKQRIPILNPEEVE
nr:membrane receptor RagA [uncultured Lachnoanaerobaculum sp.]